METITLCHHLLPVARASVDSVWFTDDIEALPADDPLRLHVGRMCFYAREVLIGRMPGPYRDEDAQAFALILAEIEFEDGYAQCRVAHTYAPPGGGAANGERVGLG